MKKIYLLFIGAFLFILPQKSNAQFTSGNLAAERLSSSSANGTAVFIDQYRVTGSTAIINASQFASTNPPPITLVESGTATSDGFITLSADNKYLCVPGYDGIAGQATIASSSVPATIGTMDITGAASTAGTGGTGLEGNNYRGLASDGTQFWLSGANGVFYSSNALGAATNQLTASGVDNSVALNLYNGNLYASVQKAGAKGYSGGLIGIYELTGPGPSFGLPTSSAGLIINTIITTSTLNASAVLTAPNAFSFTPFGDTCYIADNAKGILQFTKTGTTWSYIKTIGAVISARGMTVDYSGAVPNIYYTSGSSIFFIPDDGVTTTAKLRGAATGANVFYGLSFTPTNIVIQPLLSKICNGSPASFSITMNACAASTNYSYQWQVNNGSGWATANGTGYTATASGTNNNISTLSVTSGAAGYVPGYQYRCAVTYMGTYTLYSGTNTFAFNLPGTWTAADNNTNWNDANNWCGGVPVASENVSIPVVAANMYPVLSAGYGTVNNITISSGAAVTINGTGILSIAGNITNSGSSNIDATAGSIHITGASAAQSLDGSWFVGKTINNLLDSNTSIVDPGLYLSSLTAVDSLKISGSLSFGYINNAVFATNGNLTLTSTPAYTARLADVTNGSAHNNTGNKVTGNVTVERFFPAHRSWRLVTAPVSSSGAPTINASWQEGYSNLSRSIPQPTTPDVYGTIITKSTTETMLGAGTADGYDQGSTNNPSIIYFNNVTDKWSGVPTRTIGTAPNTNDGIITDQPGYMLFVRGNRTGYIVAGTNVAAITTTLRVAGNLNTGLQTIGGKGFTVIGNPYPSTIYFDGIYSRGTNVPQYYYAWDPFITGSNSVGGFNCFTLQGAAGSHNYNAQILPTHLDLDGSIESGQAFLVYFTDGSVAPPAQSNIMGSSSIIETDKDPTTNDDDAFRPAVPVTPVTGDTVFQQFRTTLYANNADGTTSLEDGTLDLYNGSYPDTLNFLYDAPKLRTFAENLSLLRDGFALAIEKRLPIIVTDTIFYSITQMQQKSYVLEFSSEDFNQPGLQGFLIDNYLGTRTPVPLNTTTDISFTVNSDSGSGNAARFMIVFAATAGSTLPVTFTKIAAMQQNKNVAIQWSVEDQINIKEYQVQRSVDGKNFITIGTVAALNKNTPVINYSLTDIKPLAGDNYYRIISIQNNGGVQYSQVAKVTIGGAPGIGVYPNPVINNVIGLQLNNMPAGTYNVRLLNATGQTVFIKTIDHLEGSASQMLELNNTFKKGAYELQVISRDNKTVTIPLIY